ncbi:FUSC family protein [Curtobacterium flaccumfaciens]|nr:FUSC family protein [Curtobacterium flaccumfaciens]
MHAAIAVAIVEPLALLLDGSRFYWGVIGVMIVLAGTNTTHERIRKGLHRGVGTVVGGAVGIVLVHLVGTSHPWVTLVLVCVLLAVGTYGFGGVYSLWAACLVVVLCQVYAFSGSFTDALIPMRLAENLLGAAVAVVISAVVFPIATRAVIRRAVHRQLVAVRAFVLALVGVDADAVAAVTGATGATRASRPSDERPAADLRARSRAVDAATYQLDAVLRPMVRFATGGPARADARTRASLQAAASFAREAAGRLGAAPQDPPAALDGAAHRLAESIRSLADDLVAGQGAAARPVVWARVGDLLDEAAAAAASRPDAPAVETAAHALGRIDEALALLADRHGAAVLGEAAVRSRIGGAQ